MASAAETTTTLDGLFKTRYVDNKPEDLIPDFNDFASLIPFESRPKLGKEAKFPARVKRSQGFTFAAGGNMFDLNDARPGLLVEATATQTSYVMREQIAIDAAAGATDTEDGFGDAFDEIVRDMTNTMAFHRELWLAYGQTGIGVTAGAGSSSAAVTYTLTTASSAIGLWLQLDGAPVDVYNDSSLTTKLNAVGALVVSEPTLLSDGQTVSIKLTGDAADNAAVTAGAYIVPLGWKAGSGNGVRKIAYNTGSLYGINATTYPLWQSNQIAAGGAAASMLLLTRAASIQVQRSGRKGKKLTALCSFATWNDMNNDLAALRRFGDSMKGKVELGTQDTISFYGPGVGIDIKPSALVWNSEIIMGEWSSFRRLGASDITWGLPGSSPIPDKYVHVLQDKAAYEVRAYWRQLLMPKRPACLTVISGIVNQSGS
jgi:hypothetical protein